MYIDNGWEGNIPGGAPRNMSKRSISPSFLKITTKNTCSRGAGLWICHKDQFFFPSELRGEELWQMKIRPKVEKRWHSPFLQGSGKFWDPQWRPLPGKNRHYSFPQPFGVPSLAASLSNVVCDSSRAKYVMVGQRFVTAVTECHLLVITLWLRECSALGQDQDCHYLITAPCLNCKYYPKHNL